MIASGPRSLDRYLPRWVSASVAEHKHLYTLARGEFLCAAEVALPDSDDETRALMRAFRCHEARYGKYVPTSGGCA